LSLNKKVPKEVSKGESVVCLAPAMQATLKIKVCLPPASIDIRRFAALCNTPVAPSRPLYCRCGFPFCGLGKGNFSNLLPPLCGAETGAFNTSILFVPASLYRTSGEAAGDSQGGVLTTKRPLGRLFAYFLGETRK